MPDWVKRALLYGVLALCLCGFAYVQGRASQADEMVTQGAQALLGRHQAYERAVGLLRDSEAAFVRSEASWRAKADSLGQLRNTSTDPGSTGLLRADSQGVSNSHLPPGASYPNRDSLRVIFLGRALDACDDSRLVADSALARCAARGDSLETSLRAVLAVKECRFLFLKCPSRSAFFVVGALAGALLEHRLTH